MTRLAALLLALAAPAASGPDRKWEIHLIHQTHLDIGFTHKQEDVLKRQVGFLHTALDLIEKTKDYPEEARFRWHPEGMWAVDEFLRTASPERREAFLAAVRGGSIHLDAFYVHMMTGLGTEEQLIELLQPAQDFGKRYGVKVASAIGSDVPGYTWGLVSALGQQGVKYLNMAPNNNHRLGFIYLLGNKPFYWEGPDGRHRVLSWMVPTSYIYFWGGRNRQVGDSVVRYIEKYLEGRDYPYDLAQIRYSIGGDNGHPDPTLPDQVRSWNESHDSPKIILSTNTRFFEAFEKRYGDRLPTLRGDLTPYWEDGAASTSADLAVNRRGKEILSRAEALWSILSPGEKLHGERAGAWHHAVMYDEHTWGAHCSISKPFSEFTVHQEKFKQRYALRTREMAAALEERLLAPVSRPGSRTFDVFNTASWDRPGPVTIPAGLSEGRDRLVDAEGRAVPAQRLKSGDLVALVPPVPAMASRRFALEAGPSGAAGDVKAEGNVLENGRIRIVVDPERGAIRSLVLKSQGGRELVDPGPGFGLNDYLHTIGRKTGEGYSRIESPAKIEVEETGPVVGTLRIETAAPGCERLVRRVRLYAGMDRIDLLNELDKKQELKPESVYFAFPFRVPGGRSRIDVPFAVVRPEKDQLPGANRNYYCVQRWMDVSSDEYGITWITLDAPMVQFHPFRIVGRGRGCMPAASMMFDTTPEGVPDFWIRKIEPTPFFYSWVMNNHWECNYKAYQEGPHRFEYVLAPHGPYDQTAAHRAAMEAHRPLLAVEVDGSRPVAGAPVRIRGDGVLVTSLRPSRDGRAMMIRLFAGSGKPEEVNLDWAVPRAMYVSGPGEERGDRVQGALALKAYEVVTIRAEAE